MPHPMPQSMPHPITVISARVAVVTLSDTRTPDTDKSGHLIQALLRGAGHAVGLYRVIPDEPSLLENTLLGALASAEIDAVITNGGTGISPRDQTIPMIERLLDTALPGFGELFRYLSYQEIGSAALLSRATAGVSRQKPVFALPGSTNACRLGMEKLILPELGHMLSELRKGAGVREAGGAAGSSPAP